ncbi:hypothetical protein E8E11_006126 [Didymella keratinophila]|nr:hypothetical protein E8E11_006126 [Didymella keratinophila]
MRVWDDDDIQEAKGVLDMYQHVAAERDREPHLSPYYDEDSNSIVQCSPSVCSLKERQHTGCTSRSSSPGATSDSVASYGHGRAYSFTGYDGDNANCSNDHDDESSYHDHGHNHGGSGQYFERESSFDSRSDSGGSKDKHAYDEERDEHHYACPDDSYGEHAGFGEQEPASDVCSTGFDESCDESEHQSDERGDQDDAYDGYSDSCDGGYNCEEAQDDFWDQPSDDYYCEDDY